MQQLDWDDIKLFLAVVRAGSLRAAQGATGLSYSTLSRRIGAFEERAGVALFDRDRGAYSLTPAGEDVLRVAETVEDQVAGLARRIFGQEQALEGPVSVSLIDALALSPFMEALERFARTHPGIILDIRVGGDLADLKRGGADLAVRFGSTQQEDLIGRHIMPTARAVYASHAYAERLEAGEPPGWICFTPRGAPAKWKARTPFPDAPDICFLSHMPSQLAAARAGMGLVTLPCFLADPDPGLRRLADPDFPAFQDLWILRHPDTRNNARLRVLSDFLAGALKTLAPVLKGESRTTVPLTSHGGAHAGGRPLK